MHILILNWRDSKHPLAGGAEAMVYHHAMYWKRKGATITWFSSSFTGGKKEELIDGIHIIRGGSHYTVQALGFLYYLSGKLGKPDRVVDCFHFIPFYTPLFISNRMIIALIHEVADKLWFKNISLPIATLGYVIERFSFIFYKNVPFITVSNSTKKELLQHGIKAKNITTIVNGTDQHPVGNYPKEKHPTILFAGTLSLDKGISDALTAYNEIAASEKDMQLWIFGKEEKEGALKDLIETIIKDKDIKKRIHYWGFVRENKKFELMRKSWILVHPSEKEGWGLTVVEAATQGTPTVGYDVAGLRDSIIHKKTGLLVTPTPKALAEGIITCITDQKLLASYASQSLAWSKQFDWEKAGKMSWDIISNHTGSR
jgi:glycosyltransferase involved in cell wall biosynthesis